MDIDLPHAPSRPCVQIQNASSNDQLQDMLWSDNFTFVMDCGFVKPTTTVTMEDIPALVQVVFLEYVLLRSTQEIAQFIEGFETLGIATLLRRHPRCLRKLLVHDPSEARVTVQYISVTLVVPHSITKGTQPEGTGGGCFTRLE